MASPINAILCALIATAFWTLLGFALARHLLPRVLALGAAPVIGWATHSAVMLPIYLWIGLSPMTVVAVGALCVLVSGFSLSLPAPGSEAEDAPDRFAMDIRRRCGAGAGAGRRHPAEILRRCRAARRSDLRSFQERYHRRDRPARRAAGQSRVRPVWRQMRPGYGLGSCLAYYYLWHFSAAEVALAASAIGWEADIGLTWFTAFASLTLMMGIAVWLAKRPAAAIWVVALAAAASLWITLDWIFGTSDLRPFCWRRSAWPAGSFRQPGCRSM